jgi:hypothetical protein
LVSELGDITKERLFREQLTQDFCENENQNHADKETGLLGSSSDTGIADNTNGEPGGKTSKTDRQPSTELDESSIQRKLLLQAIGDKDRHDQAVDTDNTSHNDGNNV